MKQINRKRAILENGVLRKSYLQFFNNCSNEFKFYWIQKSKEVDVNYIFSRFWKHLRKCIDKLKK